MLDTLTIAHRLTDAGLPAAHADAIAGAVREAAEAGGAVTPEMLRGEIATIRTEIATEIGAVRAEIAALRTEIATEIGAVRAEIATEIGAIRTEIATAQTATYRAMLLQGGAIVAAVGVMLRFLG